MNTDFLLQGHLNDLANKAYQKNIYTFTNFLSASDLDIFYSMLPDISHIPYEIFGGRDGCDRVMIRFGSEDTTGYDLPFPITILQITPLMDKFSDELSHRDVLGSLMNLGIEREMTEDIIMKASSRSGIRNTAYVFCVSSIADYISENLTRIKHTSVRCIPCPDSDLPDITSTLEECQCIAASERIDAVIAAVTKLSRSQTVILFREKKVFLNNRVLENNSYTLKPDDTFSIRGYGKFIYKGCGKETQKGRIYITLERYV